MTKIKFCGLTRMQDIDAANELNPDYIGFVFAKASKRYVTADRAAELKSHLSPAIRAVGVFVNEPPEKIASLLQNGTIHIAQLHGEEDETYLAALRRLTDRPIIQAFRIAGREDIRRAENSTADFVLLDSGAGTGIGFDWGLLRDIKRPYFLAGGLCCDNVVHAIEALHPYAVDVSSGIETDGKKEKSKMAAFAAAVRKDDVK